MTEVFVIHRNESGLIPFFESKNHLLPGYKVRYSGEHLLIQDDSLLLVKDEITVAIIRPESPLVISCCFRGLDQYDRETILNELCKMASALDSPIPVLIEVD